MTFISPYPPGRSANTKALRHVFVLRVHQLLKLGYDRMNAAQFHDQEEETISGELVHAIEQVLDDPNSENWLTHFYVNEERRVHHATRRGKHRLRIDIQVVSSECCPRQRFSFEAKRLRGSRSLTAYLHPKRDGLGCFLRGDYARDDDAAGMLGYVQSDTLAAWAAKLAAKLVIHPDHYCIAPNGEWSQHAMAACCPDTFRSKHNRPAVGRPIVVFHTLLKYY